MPVFLCHIRSPTTETFLVCLSVSHQVSNHRDGPCLFFCVTSGLEPQRRSLFVFLCHIRSPTTEAVFLCYNWAQAQETIFACLSVLYHASSLGDVLCLSFHVTSGLRPQTHFCVISGLQSRRRILSVFLCHIGHQATRIFLLFSSPPPSPPPPPTPSSSSSSSSSSSDWA